MPGPPPILGQGYPSHQMPAYVTDVSELYGQRIYATMPAYGYWRTGTFLFRFPRKSVDGIEKPLQPSETMMSIAPHPECSYSRAARRRWRSYFVRGNGPWAVVNKSLSYVVLFDFQFAAEIFLSERTDRTYCALVELNPDYGVPSGVTPNRLDADRVERDKE